MRRRCREPTSTPTPRTARSPSKSWPRSSGLRLGPFRVQIGRVAVERNDALFNQLDRNKDGTLTKDELGAAVTSLHRFDLDSDELIDPNELEPFSNPIAAMNEDRPRRGRFAPVPPVIELSADDPSFRPVRLVLKKYDKGTGRGAAGGDNRLEPRRVCDRPEGVRIGRHRQRRCARHRGTAPVPEPGRARSGAGRQALRAAARPPRRSSGGRDGSKPLPREVHVRRLSDGDIEIAIGELSLEFHADGGEHAAENAKDYYAGQFQAADKDNNKYLEKSEVKDHGPFAALFDTMDCDGDGKLYMKEVDEFVDQQTQAARSQMVLSVSDQGRAIFAIVDLNRDRQLSVREIRGRGCAGLVVGPQRRRPDPLRRDSAPLRDVDRPGPDHRSRHVVGLLPPG